MGEIQNKGLALNVDIFNDKGKPIKNNKGELVCKNPFPSMPLKFWNDKKDKKFKEAYFNRYNDTWHHGDFAEIKKTRGFIIHGRSDTTLNPGGVRLGTAEIYSEVEKFKEIKESIVVGQSWDNDVRIVLFIVMNEKFILSEDLLKKIKLQIRKNASPRHVPSKVIVVKDIPRTKSGKIVELAVKNTIEGNNIKNKEALANPKALEQFKNLKELNIGLDASYSEFSFEDSFNPFERKNNVKRTSITPSLGFSNVGISSLSTLTVGRTDSKHKYDSSSLDNSRNWAEVSHKIYMDNYGNNAVSYTHLTLPTKA